MEWFSQLPRVYLHRDPVDFRKAAVGLSQLVEYDLSRNPFDGSLYVFCNKQRNKLKILHWDQTGFVLWYKRLEKEKFNWPRDEAESVVLIDESALRCLLSGLPIRPPKGHTPLYYQPLS